MSGGSHWTTISMLQRTMAAGLKPVILLLVTGFLCVRSQNPTFCLLSHCKTQLTNCMGDSVCKQALLCVQPCGGNQTCNFLCLYSYDDPTFDTFMQCAVTDYQCIKLTPPDHPVQCKKPNNFIKNFTLSDLNGTWYLIKGLNRLNDCFDCYTGNYSSGTSSTTAHLLESFNVMAIDGSVRHIQTSVSLLQADPTNGGVINYTSTIDGLNRNDEYRVLGFSPDQGYIFVYYCGAIDTLVFDGAMVFSRTPSLSPNVLTEVKSVAASFGYNLDTFCSPKTGC